MDADFERLFAVHSWHRLLSPRIIFVMNEISDSEAALIGKALGDPTRLAIYTEIANCCDEMFCGELDAMHKISAPTISHHLKVLSDLGLITSRKEGLHVFYKAVPEKMSSYLKYLSRIGQPGSAKTVRVKST